MRPLLGLLFVAACGAGTEPPVSRAGQPDGERAPDGERPTAAGTGPVVVELFTSQGCSSCPPADAYLSEVAAAGRVGERAVAPLAFHVDYWDDLGWADPWARAAWTERQRAYAEHFRDRRVYTPALVIAGRGHVVGSDRRGAAARIAAAPAPALLEARATWTATTVAITATAPTDGDAWVAIYEDGLTTAVTRGENADRRLRNDRVVRTLVRVAAAGTTATVTVDLDPAWRQVGALAFAGPATGAIVASRELGRR